jgi:DNA-binding transcriptional regulator WhiA
MTITEQVQILEDICPALKHHISKREIRHSFFQNIKTEIQAYLLGFFIADGSVDYKRKTLRVQLNENDSEIINLYRDYISTNARIFKVHGHSIEGRHGEKY